MKFRISTSWAHKMDSELLEQLRTRLTVKRDSGMRAILNVVEHNKLWIAVAYHKDRPVGWLILECRDVCYAQVYVKRGYRGRGIGTLLLKRAKRMATKRGKRLLVAELDRSAGFFAKAAQQIELWWHPMSPEEKPRLI